MKRPALIALAVLLLTACGDSDSEEPLGDPAVYTDINATTDCAALQEGFDRNMDDVDRREPGDPLRDVVMAYAEAYNDRLETVGCYD